MNYGKTDKEALAIIDALTSFHHLLAGNEFRIVIEHQPLLYLKTSKTPTQKQLRWRGFIGQFRTKLVYRPGQRNCLADALSRLYTEDNNYPHTAQDPTQEDLENEDSPLTHFIKSYLANMSRFEPLEVEYARHFSDCHSDCRIHQAMFNPSDYRNKDHINLWGDYRSISSGRSYEEIQYSAQHWTDCRGLLCPNHEDDRIRSKVYAGSLSSSPILDNLRKEVMEMTMDKEPNEKSILSPRPGPDLIKIKRRLHEALGCTTSGIPCEGPECSVHQTRRLSPSKPLY